MNNSSLQESQENRSVQSPKHINSPSHSDNDIGSRTSVPTERPADASVDSDTNAQSGQSTIPSRRNLHTSQENDLIAKAVAGMNARKLEMDKELSQSEVYESRLNPQNERGGNAIQENSKVSSDVSGSGELKGGSLMRALIHEQDASGHEALNDIDSFKILPAGKMVQVDKKAKVKSSNSLNSFVNFRENRSQSMHYSDSNRQGVNELNGSLSPNRVQPVVTNTCETLRPSIPGGDIATTSPLRRSGFSEQELFLLERLQSSYQSPTHGRSSSDTRQLQSMLDNDIPAQRLSLQGVRSSNHVEEQLQGDSPSQYQSPNKASSVTSPSNGKELHSPSQNGYNRGSGYESSDSESQRSQTSTSSVQPNPKLQSLFQKLKQQQQQNL